MTTLNLTVFYTIIFLYKNDSVIENATEKFDSELLTIQKCAITLR